MRRFHEWQVGKDVEGTGYGLFEVTVSTVT
jgi:hypothetical protein